MATFTLARNDRFPNGTSVAAYPDSNWLNSVPKTDAAPVGSSAATATMSGGTATFTGLTQGAHYQAYALVNSEHRYVGFIAGADTPGDQIAREGDNEHITGAWTFDQPVAVGAAVGSGDAVQKSVTDALDARLVDIEAEPAFAELVVFGHSYAAGSTGPSSRERTYAGRLAAYLRAKHDNRAGAGANIITNTQVGLVAMLQQLPRNVITTAPYDPVQPLAILDYGINDLNALVDSFSSRTSLYIEAMRCAIARLRASSVKEDSDASVAYSGTDWTNTAQTTNSGSSVRTTTVNGAVATITVPADYSGTVINIGVQDTTPNGAVYTVKEGTTTLATLDSRPIVNGLTAGTTSFHVLRVSGLAAGAHTLTLTVTSIDTGGTVAFDYWSIEAETVPVVLVHNIARAISYASYGTPAPDDAAVTAANALLTSLVAEFDQWVKLIDVDAALNKTASLFFSDSLHPNDAGHKAIFDADLAALQALPITTARAKALSTIRDRAVPTVASAAPVHLPAGADIIKVSGTTGFTNLYPVGQPGRQVVLIFTGALTVTDGGNLKLAGNFVTTADDTLRLVSDGTSWYEIGRSVN